MYLSRFVQNRLYNSVVCSTTDELWLHNDKIICIIYRGVQCSCRNVTLEKGGKVEIGNQIDVVTQSRVFLIIAEVALLDW